ncbi:hypothetical protein [Amycolatopsis alkalitolerans]|uniref:Uncharacterized protein n=1 Tax=Amycolatopsis alkalitolerans TaxID=2547244 RepID=A0A5C4LZW3_9PSEU|nr:hypothetical protein [Amycolatopsis alkalitolerans]TNC24828.1 hypothetical protein FG385_16400 [Amycolatopsis alkalitolerans]
MEFLTRFREFLATQAELAQRQELLNRPWEEELLHWSYDGRGWRLHGHRVPPRGRRRSTTRQGWCPGLRATQLRAEPLRDRENS